MSNAPYLLEPLQELMLTILHTAMVRDAVPISAVLVAQSGTAKSKILKQFHGLNGQAPAIHHTDSFSSQGLFQLMQSDIHNKIRYIVMPDFNPTLSRQQKTVSSTVANLLTLTMDGTCRIDDGRTEKIVNHKPIGLLSAVTPEMFETQNRKWFALGLTRRILPIFYEYTSETVHKLLEIVRDGKIGSMDFAKIDVNLDGQHSPAIDNIAGLSLEGMSASLAHNLGMIRGKDSSGKKQVFLRKIVPISPVVILRTLAQAHAIRRRSGQVGREDIEFISQFIDFTNPIRPKQL